MIIRDFKLEDTERLRQIFFISRQKAWPWLESSHWKLDDFDKETKGEKIWVAETSQHILGFAAVWEEDNFLHHLFIDPQYQHIGVGRALLAHVTSQFTATGALKCLVKNTRALQFYLKHDWHIEGEGNSAEGNYYLLKFDIE